MTKPTSFWKRINFNSRSAYTITEIHRLKESMKEREKMKHIKKLMTLVLAFVMALGMATTVFAAVGDYNITITNDNNSMSINGKQYKAYKVFALTLGGKTTTTATDPETGAETSTDSYSAYAYSIKNTDWAWAKLTTGATTAANGVITTSYGIKLTPSAADPTTYVVDGKTMTEANARSLADALQSVLPSSADGTGTGANESATIQLSDPGYYAVYGVVIPTDPEQQPAEEVIAAVALTTTDPDAEVKPKASVPTIDKKIKKVQEGTTEISDALLDTKGQAAVAKVGSTVTYEITATTPDLTGYTDYTYIIGDDISAGLTYDKSSFTLTINGAAATFVTSTTAATDDNELIFKTGDKGFDLTIPYSVLQAAGAGKNVVLTYSCTVNSSALTYDYENNTADLTYSKSPYDNTTNKTPEKKTYVIDLNLDVDKIDGSDSTKHLDGAEFKLYREVTSTAEPAEGDGATAATTTKEYYKWDATNGKVTWVATQAAGDSFTTDSTGKLSQQVRGLDKGTYYFEETVAPKGYNLLSAPVAVVITVVEAENGETVTYSATYGGENATMTNGAVNLASETQASGKQPVATGTIQNNSGTELPSTGGIGTTIFYTIGAILVLGAGIVLVTRRKMNAN